MWTYNQTESLYHHGVKGMKWGRRRQYTGLGDSVGTYNSLGYSSPVGKNDYNSKRQIRRTAPGEAAEIKPVKLGKLSVKQKIKVGLKRVQLYMDRNISGFKDAVEEGKSYLKKLLKK